MSAGSNAPLEIINSAPLDLSLLIYANGRNPMEQMARVKGTRQHAFYFLAPVIFWK
ncbi:MAG: hypothetical protein WA061_05740 [Microgenomates group bacterium]